MRLFKSQKKESKAKEVFYKIYSTYELPVAMIGFTTKDKNDVIQLGKSIWVSFKDSHEANIKKMRKIEKTKGFMFWDNSEEGEAFFKKNANAISGILVKMVMSQH